MRSLDLGVLPVDAPGRFVVRPPARSLFGGVVFAGFLAALGLWLGSVALQDDGSGRWLPGAFALFLLVLGSSLLIAMITAIARPVLRADPAQLRLGNLPPVPWRDIRQVTITRIETWTKYSPEADGRFRYAPQHMIRLHLYDGAVREWTSPNAEAPWTAENLAAGLRRTSPTTSVQVEPITEYRGGPQVSS